MKKGLKIIDWIEWECQECWAIIHQMDLKETDWEEANRDEEEPVCPYCNSEVQLYEPDPLPYKRHGSSYDTIEEMKGDR